MDDCQCKPLRWGIFGCGKISNDFCVALKALPTDEHKIEHVADMLYHEDAEKFAQKFDVEKYTTEPLDVVCDECVDVCYVGTVNSTHKELCLLAMNHGKAVLCEKPVMLNSKDLNEVIQCAKENNVFFMEALWTRFFPLYKDLLSKFRSGFYGEPNVLIGTFGTENAFTTLKSFYRPELGGGMLRNRCIYLLHVLDMFFDGNQIKDVIITASMHETGVDQWGTVNVLFEGNKIGYLMYSGEHQLPNEVKIMCSKGTINLPQPFHCPETYTEEMKQEGGGSIRQTFDYTLPPPPMKMNFPNSMGLQFEAQHVRECLLTGKLESPIMPHETSKRIIGWIDTLYKQITVDEKSDEASNEQLEKMIF